MALYERQIRDGIQLAHGLDYCWKCHKPGTVIDPKDNIEYQEVFKMHVNGLEHCLCMKHLQELLGDYRLTHKDALSDDVISIPKKLVEEGTEQDVITYIKKVVGAKHE